MEEPTGLQLGAALFLEHPEGLEELGYQGELGLHHVLN